MFIFTFIKYVECIILLCIKILLIMNLQLSRVFAMCIKTIESMAVTICTEVVYCLEISLSLAQTNVMENRHLIVLALHSFRSKKHFSSNFVILRAAFEELIWLLTTPLASCRIRLVSSKLPLLRDRYTSEEK